MPLAPYGELSRAAQARRIRPLACRALVAYAPRFMAIVEPNLRELLRIAGKRGPWVPKR